tara:strand:- start:141 stop:698 length:558 start_codon:yes stop_codon:yes gene_type:complete
MQTKPKATQKRNSYQTYYKSGYYDQRYPTPNRSMWRRIKKYLEPAASVLDYGCGSGWYLFTLREHVTRAVGFEVSPVALALVRERATAIAWETVTLVGPATDDLDDHLTSHGQVNLVLCLFGVLGHITDPTERASALRRMHGALTPDTGHLLISVPNIARRFRKEQKKGVLDGLANYSRESMTSR